MTTRVFRVARVLLGTVARIDAVDAEGHALRLEVPMDEAQRATAGRVLVLQWSLHDLPAALAPETAQTVQTPETVQAERAGSEIAVGSEATGRSVDEDFMALMARGRQGAPASAQPTSARAPDRDIQDEFNMLLGSTRAKGQK